MKKLSECRTLFELTKAYRKGLFEVHPDYGGTAEGFREFHEQYEKRKAELSAPPPATEPPPKQQKPPPKQKRPQPPPQPPKTTATNRVGATKPTPATQQDLSALIQQGTEFFKQGKQFLEGVSAVMQGLIGLFDSGDDNDEHTNNKKARSD